MKHKTILVIAISAVLNLVLGTLLFSSHSSYDKMKASLINAEAELKEASAKLVNQQRITDELYADFKVIKSDKEKLTGTNKVLNSKNKSLSQNLSVVSSQLNKMKSRQIAGKKNSSKKKYSNKNKSNRYKKKTKRCK